MKMILINFESATYIVVSAKWLIEKLFQGDQELINDIWSPVLCVLPPRYITSSGRAPWGRVSLVCICRILAIILNNHIHSSEKAEGTAEE